MSKHSVPETSHIANRMADASGLKEIDKQKILVALEKLGVGIYTDIAEVAKMDKVAVGRRLTDLEEEGKIWKNGCRKNTPSGRPANVYQLTKPPIKTEKELRYTSTEKTAAEYAKDIITVTQTEFKFQ